MGIEEAEREAGRGVRPRRSAARARVAGARRGPGAKEGRAQPLPPLRLSPSQGAQNFAPLALANSLIPSRRVPRSLTEAKADSDCSAAAGPRPRLRAPGARGTEASLALRRRSTQRASEI